MLSVKEFCARHSSYYEVVQPPCMGWTWDAVTGERCAVPQPEIYQAVIRASIRGGTGTVAPSGELVGDAPLDPNAEKADYGDSAGFWAQAPAGVHRAEWAVHFQAAGAGNWFHWVLELLPRLEYLTMPGPLLVSDINWEVPQFREALRALTDREVIAVPFRVQWDVPNLVMLGRSLWLPPHLRDGCHLDPGDFLVSRAAIDYLRRLAHPGKPTRKLWITRTPKTAPPRLQNEPVVRAFFEAHGFEAIRPDEMTFDQQREVFGSATVIAAESGAGLTNLLWAPEGARVICLRVYPWRTNPYCDLAGHLGQEWVSCHDEPASEPSNQAGFYGDPERLAERLRDVL